ncbi:MAG: DUF547 domain-containing protein [Pirellulales bacterium]|nr:DUF547 domain-containing protein [Pirellulales bacterium]
MPARALSTNFRFRMLAGVLVLAALALALLLSVARIAGQRTLGATYAANQLLPIDAIDHALWDELTHRYVDRKGDVAYARWQFTSADIGALDGYLEELSRADPSLPAARDARLAYWINAYNALTVRGILQEYPTASIRDHTPRWLGYNLWRDLRLVVGNRPISVEAIEHRVLRPLGEPRIHFAIVCASRGCPRLRREAYTASRIEEQLSDNARSFFADRTKFQCDLVEKICRVSPILQWFQGDFGPTPNAALQSLVAYLPAEARSVVAGGDFQLKYLPYDWRLNDRSTRGKESA